MSGDIPLVELATNLSGPGMDMIKGPKYNDTFSELPGAIRGFRPDKVADGAKEQT